MTHFFYIYRSRLVETLALALAVWLCAGNAARAQEGAACAQCGRVHQACTGPACGPQCNGTGFQGFGLGYHLGYGYGGCALGTGPDGGYPFYSGPGYPHPWPCLRRCKRIVPFPYYGGPGYPTPAEPHYYGPVGPLAPDRPVVTVGTEMDYPGEFGNFTGTLPYSEEFLAPFTTRAAAAGSRSGVSSPAPEATTAPPASTAPPFSTPTPPSPSTPGASAARTQAPANARTATLAGPVRAPRRGVSLR